MLSEDFLFVDFLVYAGWGIGAILFLVGVFKKGLRLLIIIGIAVPGGAIVLAASEKVVLNFNVVVMTESDQGMAWQHVRSFSGGEYQFGDGTQTPITKPEGGMIATVVINDSDRPVRVVRVAYAAANKPPGFGGRDDVMSVAPGRTGGTLKRIGHIGPESEGPPDTIDSATSYDTLDWLTW
jgi:hypothetical protein